MATANTAYLEKPNMADPHFRSMFSTIAEVQPPTSMAGVDALAESVSAAAKNMRQAILADSLKIEERRRVHEADLADISDVKSRQTREAKFQDFRRGVLAASDKTRTELLRSLTTASQKATMGKDFFRADVMATSFGLGTQERANLMTQLSGMGNGGTLFQAQKAASEGNKMLASALIAVNSAKITSDQPFSNQDLSNRIWGPESAAAKSKLANVDLEAQRAVLAHREFVSGKTDAKQRMNVALQAHSLNG